MGERIGGGLLLTRFQELIVDYVFNKCSRVSSFGFSTPLRRVRPIYGLVRLYFLLCSYVWDCAIVGLCVCGSASVLACLCLFACRAFV